MVKIGERVGAICGEEDGVIEIFGYGVYEGEHDFAIFGDKDLSPNPLIKLDNGGYVFGCQCWWGSEAKIQETLKSWEDAGKTIRVIPPLQTDWPRKERP